MQELDNSKSLLVKTVLALVVLAAVVLVAAIGVYGTMAPQRAMRQSIVAVSRVPVIGQEAAGRASSMRLDAPLQFASHQQPLSRPAYWASELATLVNGVRAESNLGPLMLCEVLSRAAQTYSAMLADRGSTSHTAPEGSLLADRVSAAGYQGWTAVEESIAFGKQSAAELMDAWMRSPEQRDKMLRPEFTHLGLGRTDRDYGYRTATVSVQYLGTGGSC